MTSGYKPWMLAAMEEAGYMGITDDMINKIADELISYGSHEISLEAFVAACSKFNINPNNFEQEDLDRLVNRLNERG